MKRAFLCLFLTVALVGAAHAQTGLNGGVFGSSSINPQAVVSDNASINILTTVINRLQVTSVQDVDFGFVTADPTAATQYTPVQQGQFTINGEPSSEVSLTPSISNATPLTGGSGSVTFTPQAVGGSVVLGTGGDATIDVTGVLDVSAGASGGFSGTYQLDVEYLSI